MDMNLEIWLLLELVSQQNDRALSDSAPGEVLPDISTMSARQLLKLMAAARLRLEELGTDEAQAVQEVQGVAVIAHGAVGAPTKAKSQQVMAMPALRITKDLRIFLVEGNSGNDGNGENVRHSTYAAREIQLKPLCRMLFILFLRHPEGINFKDLILYEQEMLDIYGRITRRGDALTMQRSIRHITDSTNSLMSVHRSQLSRSLGRYIDKTILPQYLISTGKGSTRSIPLSRELVEWE